ncbi:hypothetical protein HT105_21155, partial [Bacteroides fragilis]|nr:hypothetical protein [Bacteroides fragilis]
YGTLRNRIELTLNGNPQSKAMFTARKQQILLDAQYADEAEALDAELVEDTTEESAA